MPRRKRCILPKCRITSPSAASMDGNLSGVDDRHVYLGCSAQSCRCGVRLLGWCLMTNHVHLVAVPERADSLSILMRRVHGRFAQYTTRAPSGRATSDRIATLSASSTGSLVDNPGLRGTKSRASQTRSTRRGVSWSTRRPCRGRGRYGLAGYGLCVSRSAQIGMRSSTRPESTGSEDAPDDTHSRTSSLYYAGRPRRQELRERNGETIQSAVESKPSRTKEELRRKLPQFTLFDLHSFDDGRGGSG